MQRFAAIFGVLLLLLLVATVGCAPSRPVRYFIIIPSPEGMPSTFIPPPNANNPFPTNITNATPGEPLYLYFDSDKNFKGSMADFTFTFDNEPTKTEAEAIFAPWPGTQGILPGPYCYAPDEPGNYELEIHYQDKVVAAALVNVGLAN